MFNRKKPFRFRPNESFHTKTSPFTVFIWNPLKNAATLAHSHHLWIFLDKQLLQQFTQHNHSQKKNNRIKHKEKLI